MTDRRFSIPLLFALFFAGALSVQAQSGVQVQVLGGGQNTWMFNQEDSDEGDALDYEPTFGAQYGAKVAFFFSDKIGLETGLVLSKQGQDYEHNVEMFGQETTYHTSRTLTYMKVPVLLHLRSQPDEAAYFTAFLGPQFSLLSGFSSDADEEIAEGTWGEEEDYSDNTTDLVLGFGPGFSFTDKLKMDLHFRFDYSFTDAEDKSSDKWNDDRSITNNVTGGLQLGLTYAFGG